MNSTTLNIINEKLKDKPEKVLKQVLGYLDGILENNSSDWYDHNLNYTLTEQQKRELDSMHNLTAEDFKPIENFYAEMKEKYDL